MDTLSDLFLEVKHLVQEVLQLQVEGVHALLGLVCCITRSLYSQFFQPVQLLQSNKQKAGLDSLLCDISRGTVFCLQLENIFHQRPGQEIDDRYDHQNGQF